MKEKITVLALAAGMSVSLFGCGINNETNEFSMALSLSETLHDIPLKDVEILDSYEQNAFSLEIQYLKSLDSDRLLRGFCDIAGIESDAELYGGWENAAIKGHTLGHYLSALSHAYTSSEDEELKAISDHIIDILALCQNKESGYLAAIPESHYIQLEEGNTSGTWVPWYTMHKVLAGLLDAYDLTDNEKALQIASDLADWVYGRTSVWDKEIQKNVLSVEYGGMNDCLYRLYGHTKSDKHLSAAHSFDEMDLFDPIYMGEDILNGKHANTTIPKIIGALERYIVLGESEEYYLQTAANFWEIVTSHHTYITGGNSEWEHFGEADILDAERTNCNCETCNTYNMLKLSRELFKITGEIKYADYYENTYINAILSSQNPETGMTTYFQPMATGFFKVYSTATENFWCCTGSGMENFSKLADSIFYQRGDSIYITRYSSAKVLWREKGLRITQKADLPNISISVEGSATADILLRIPDWCTDKISVKINGKSVETEEENSFIRLSREWKSGDIIELNLPMKVVAYGLQDSENTFAFKYGPWVLSASLGDKDMQTTSTGVNVTIPLLDSSVNDIITVRNLSVKEWLENINENLVSEDDTLNFTLKGTDRNLVFSPHYMQYMNRYGIYFKLVDENTPLVKDKSDNYMVIDSFPVGNEQYEFSHNLSAENSSSGNFKGFIFRDASPGGYFSYQLDVDKNAKNYLVVKYYSGDAGRKFHIFVDDTELAFVSLEDENPNGFYDIYYEIPKSLTAGKEKIIVKFCADSDSYAGGIFDKLIIVIDK